MQLKLSDRPYLREILVKYLQNRCGITALRQLLAIALLASACLSFAQNAPRSGFGVAWRVKGGWRIEGEEKQITTGAAIKPGALLEAIPGKSEHSITLLLPDGQRILYECFKMQDCERGFRVPNLYREPDSISVDLLARVNAVISRGQRRTSSADTADKDVSDEASLPRDEAAAVLGADHRVEIAGLAAALSNGSYWYEVRPLASPARAQAPRAFNKTGHSIALELPSEGLFDVSIRDQANRPRIDLLLLAVRAQDLKLVKSFEEVRALLKDWNEDYQGWSVHDFQSDYLRSIALHIEPGAPLSQFTRKHASANTTAEPRFSPRAGAFAHDIEVTLRCDTPGATLYYTVDGSQPLHQSSVYHAPIVVKGTALTIKAFASAEGKKDSPVVTGIFRIGDS